MFSLILKAAKYFSENSNTIDADIDNAFEKLEVIYDEDENKEDLFCKNSDTEGCYYANGIVTSITTNSVLVDDLYICDLENVSCQDLDVGCKVHYFAYQKDKNTDPKIRKIISKVFDDDINDDNNYTKRKIEKKQMLKKCIVTKVEKREGRIVYCQPLNIKFNLDKVNSTFLPYIGDWLKLDCLVEVDELSDDLSGEILEVNNMQPLRSKLKIANVTKYDSHNGIGYIEYNTIFNKSSCEPGYIPSVGDKVVCDSIESDQDIYKWRCLTVVPLSQSINNNKNKNNNNNTTTIANEPKKILDQNKEMLLQNKNGINITENLEINMDINEQKILQVVIANCGCEEHTLNKCIFMSRKSNSQLSLIWPDILTVTPLQSGETITYKFLCTAKSVGSTEEFIIFRFENFYIGRYVKIVINAKYLLPMNVENTQVQYNGRKLIRQDDYDQGSYIPGVRPYKPPPFIPVRNTIFKIPQRFWDVLLPCLNRNMAQVEIESIVGQALPCLYEALSKNNYKDRFHALLYLEEISLIVHLQRYDMNSVVMIPRDEYLVLNVPGLVEKRPSLIIGDRAIITFKWDASGGNIKHEGFIHKIQSSEIYLKFNPEFHSTYNKQDCQVSFKSSFSSIGRCHNSINLAIIRLGTDILFPMSIIEKEPQVILEEENADEKSKDKSSDDKYELSLSSPNSENPQANLLTALMATNQPQNNCTPNELDPYTKQVKTRKLVWFNKKLNYYQKEAVRNIICGVARPLPYIIFGPPGTGKTITLCETILQIITTIPESRLLIATPSNSSANLITERLLDSEVLKPGDLVRLIARRCFADDLIPEKLLPYCATSSLAAENTTKDYYRSNEGVKVNCPMSVLGRHRITVGTCIALGSFYNMGFPHGHFTHILVDEAGQATEAEIMVPLTLTHYSYGQIILAGDPMQLGPIVTSRVANHFGLGESFLVRLLQQFPYQRDNQSFKMGYDPRLVTKLIINYRSLPEILELPNSLFYELELKAYLSATASPEAEFLVSIAPDLPSRNGETPPAIVFHGVDGENQQDSDSPSWYNPAEATQVYLYLLRFYDRGVTENDIGIITPYKKQVSQIRALLMEMNMLLPKIGSVEEFQGQERKIIIISAVRSTSDHVHNDIRHSLGFVASPRRLNVAITRARSLLIILGNPNLLSQDPYWRTVLNYCIDNKSYTGCNFSSANINDKWDNFDEIGIEDYL